MRLLMQPWRLLLRQLLPRRTALVVLALLPLYYWKICTGEGASECLSGINSYQVHQTGSIEVGGLDQSLSRPVTGSDPTVHLVMATVVGDDISWTQRVTIQNLKVLQYVADDQKAPYHPEKNKGREATMYHTYFYDFYDKLPDISIMIHAHEDPWHAESVLLKSMITTLNQLDLREVQRRGYANLRVSWENACPDWINTTVPAEESQKQEEPYMRPAIGEIYDNKVPVPDVLAAPCCSQFAVTGDSIRAIPREEFGRYKQWLLDTPLPDYISGRVWEHLFQHLFTKKAVDCPTELKTFCTLYHVCFESSDQLQEYIRLGWEATDLQGKLGFWQELRYPDQARKARLRIKEIETLTYQLRGEALKRGSDEKLRLDAMRDIYAD